MNTLVDAEPLAPSIPQTNAERLNAYIKAQQASLTEQCRDTPPLGSSAHLSKSIEIPHAAAVRMGRQQAFADVVTAAPLVLMDIVATLLAGFFSIALVQTAGGSMSVSFALGVVAVVVLFQLLQGSYPSCGVSGATEFHRALKTVLATSLVLALNLLAINPEQSGGWLGWSVLTVLLFAVLPPTRPVTRRLLADQAWWTQSIVLIAHPQQALNDLNALHSARREGLRPAGLVVTPAGDGDNDIDPSAISRAYVDTNHGVTQPLHTGGLQELEQVLRVSRASRLIITDYATAARNHLHLFRGIPQVTLPPAPGHHIGEKARLIESCGRPAFSCRSKLTCPWAMSTKRAIDLALVLFTSPVWLSVMLLLGILVKCTSRGPVFFRQTRVGRFSKPFVAFKFRSMVLDADQKLADYLASDPDLKAEWDATHKLKKDPRVTAVGRFLRNTSLDELPQLLNVLLGDMSLVGPRPIIDCNQYDRQYIDEHPEVFGVYEMARPGITGLWQVCGRNRTAYKERIHYDRVYLDNWSISLDLFILWRTIKTALLSEGAC